MLFPLAISDGVEAFREVLKGKKARAREGGSGDVGNYTTSADVRIGVPCKGQAEKIGQHEGNTKRGVQMLGWKGGFL